MGYTGQHLKPSLTTRTNWDALIAWSNHVVASVRKSPSFNNLIDLSAVLIHFGRLPEAVQLLKFIEHKYPDKYQTASNIGTAYELLGKNEEALKWIREGIRRNPDDHFGTEWLHVQILNAKLGRIPSTAPGRSILNLDFGKDAMPRRPENVPLGNDGKPLALYSLGNALRYQLLERIKFVPAPDPIVAGLLLDWANLELLAGAVESADVLYDAAVRYGINDGPTILMRKKQVGQILAHAKKYPTAKTGQCELCVPPE
jgi:tetratricopeptide (TPR) repeat protein